MSGQAMDRGDAQGRVRSIAVPLEVWFVMFATAEREPGTQQRYEDGEDSLHRPRMHLRG
jgi:hypothetical protein